MLNSKSKKSYLKSLDLKQIDTNRTFWKVFKPLFSTKYTPVEKVILIEHDVITTNDCNIAEIFNDYFCNITQTLDIFNWPSIEPILLEDDVSYAIRKYAKHPSIIRIKSTYKRHQIFEFETVSPDTIKSYINKLNAKKMSSGGIPVSVLKEFMESYCIEFTDCVNTSINNCIFPSNMKLGDVSPIF